MKASLPKTSAIYTKLVLMLSIGCALFLSAKRADAFALLGPYEAWMQYTNGLRQPGDIGGPMDIGNGYRWNVPVVTYGFDKSFRDYFGTNGVAAVEAAIQILNDLPPASQAVLTNYPLLTRRINYRAQAAGLVDLKSEALSLIIEQLGLAQPSRYTFVLEQWSPSFTNPGFLYNPTNLSWAYSNNYLAQRNFDSASLLPSNSVDGILYDFALRYYGGDSEIELLPIYPEAGELPAVADNNSLFTPGLAPGEYVTGLTEDDVGGLCYLYSTNNIAYEDLLPDVRRHDDRRERLINGARRPGIAKLTFVPQPTERRTGRFLPLVCPYDDKYITNGRLMTQPVERVIEKPDFLFCAKNITNVNSALYFDRTATTNWINNSAPNRSPGGGPGVIVPQIKITFNRLGHFIDFYSDGFDGDFQYSWASFDGSTNAPVAYPIAPEGTKSFVINMWLSIYTNFSLFPPPANAYEWRVTDPIGSVSLFQTSSNMTDWLTMFSATNDGTSWYLFDDNPTASPRFYRVVPQ